MSFFKSFLLPTKIIGIFPDLSRMSSKYSSIESKVSGRDKSKTKPTAATPLKKSVLKNSNRS
ncbi:hypothetical protein ES705_49255 [subsurface metagenome]